MKIKRIAILPYSGPRLERTQSAYDLTREVKYWLERQGIVVVTSIQEIKRGFKPDLICVLGGDGMFIRTIRALIHLQAPFLGVNFGTKGFLLPIMPEEFEDFLNQVLCGEQEDCEERVAIEAYVIKNGERRGPFVCINDVVVKSDFYMVTLEVRENGKVRIRPQADGVIIATPTGSTAYNHNAGGTTLSWNSPNFVATAIACANRVDAKCLLGVDTQVEVEVVYGRVAFIPDGIIKEGGLLWLNPGDRVAIKVHPKTFRILVPEGFDSYERMKKLLS